MSAGPARALGEAPARSPQIASSAVVVGTARLGEGSLLAEGADQRDRLAEIAERTPVTVAVRAGTPITSTIEPGPP